MTPTATSSTRGTGRSRGNVGAMNSETWFHTIWAAVLLAVIGASVVLGVNCQRTGAEVSKECIRSARSSADCAQILGPNR